MPNERGDFLLFQRIGVSRGIIAAFKAKAQSRPVCQGLDESVELRQLRRLQLAAARRELLERQLVATAAEHRAYKGKRGDSGLGEQVDDHAQNHFADAEIRVVKTALHRQVDDDLSVEVLEERHSEPNGKACGVGAVGDRAERELVECDDIGGVDRFSGEVKPGVHEELPSCQLVACELPRVGTERHKIDILHVDPQVHELA